MTEILEAHAPLGPSGAHRWTVCEGSVEAEAKEPDNPSIYAATGTLYHEKIAECLLLGLDPFDFVGKKFTVDGYEIEFTEVFAKAMQDAIDRIMELAEGGELHVETRVDISPYTLPGQFGTTDIAIIQRKMLEIIIWDHKFGEGVAVTAVENLQSILYALGLWNTVAAALFEGVHPRDVKVRIMIDQPRARVHVTDDDEDEEDEDEGVLGEAPVEKFTEWQTTMEELLVLWAPWLRERAKATQWADAPRTPGTKQCFFCKAKKKCKARAQWFMEMVTMDLENLDEIAETGVLMTKLPVDPKSLTVQQRIVLAENRGAFLAFFRECYESVIDDYMRGFETPTVKVVRGRRGPRYWVDKQTAERKLKKLLKDAAYEKKLLSPTKVEDNYPEVWKTVDPDSEVSQSEGKPTLVSENDPRPAMETAIEGFDHEAIV